jgi:pimeloyl-ACP methyl ester carboxylesterase
MVIYGISGLGADERVYDYLNLQCEFIFLDWIPPFKNEPIEEYSKRFAIHYNLDKLSEFIIMGLSFGGLIATEISKMYNPKLTILISSVETKKEINIIGRWAAKICMLKTWPIFMFLPPKMIIQSLFRTKEKELLSAILDDTDLNFVKWAFIELLNWKNMERLPNLLKLSGENDKLFKSKTKNAIIIPGGEHFMIVDKAKEVSALINKGTNSL